MSVTAPSSFFFAEILFRTDGATRAPDGDLGIIMKAGTNLQITELAPGATAASVRSTLGPVVIWY